MTKTDVVPEGWSICTIGDVVTYDGIFKDGDWIESKDQDPNGDVRLIQLADIGDGYFVNKSARFLTKSKAFELNCTFLREGDLLIARMPDPLGRCCIFPLAGDGKYVTVVDVCVIRLEESTALHKHMMYLINSPIFRADISSLQSGSTRKRISRKNLATVNLLLAPYKEQHRIVAKIEQLFSELDKGIESLKTAREQLKVYRQAVLKHAFEGKLTAQWREENKGKLETADQLLARIQKEREARYQQQLEEWEVAVTMWEEGGKLVKKPIKPKKYKPSILEDSVKSTLRVLPDGWLWVRFSELLYSIRGGTTVPPIDEETCFPILRSSSVRAGVIDYNDVRYIEEEKIKSKLDFVENKDLLFSRLNGTIEFVGNCAVINSGYPENLIYPDRLYCAKLVDKSLASYSEYFFSSPVVRMSLEHKAKSTAGHKRISIPDVTNLFFQLPSIYEAEEIAYLLDENFSLIRKLEKDIEDNLASTKALRQSILKKAFSGQLVEQDPNDEPTPVLLERIKAEKAQQQPKKKTARKRKAVTA